MKSVQRVLSLLLFITVPYVESYINWEGNWEGRSNWTEIPDGVFAGPGVGSARGTDFCDVVRNKSFALKDALRGKNLSIASQYGPGFDFFQYNPDEPLSETNPAGMIANVLMNWQVEQVSFGGTHLLLTTQQLLIFLSGRERGNGTEC